ncbi:MAG TPA: histidine--tRNA ligase [Ginsengibacter sp.]|nr:histidine--tRNA ligase [Ginsengibacter sp.]HRP43997.1 histidine--tRNA ligase [Ginsengibacter sp.]
MKPSLPQGTRDFESEVLRKRLHITNTIKETFELFGFQPLETPAMENLDTLMGKYGQEGDKLIFKILNNGLDNPSKLEESKEAFANVLSGKNDRNLTSRALRYDLTIPFARYVATHYHQLVMPFKRYQVQPVWRADRPQKGRYREFLQCDADVAGTRSLIADAEFGLLYKNVFEKLQIPVRIRLNNRKVLYGIAEVAEHPELLSEIVIAIDKLDKIGKEEVMASLQKTTLSEKGLKIISDFLAIDGTAKQRIDSLKALLKNSSTGMQGVSELEEVFTLLGFEEVFELDTTLARGLDYYTGTIFEVIAPGVKMGSIGGGGRYDNLTGLFGVSDVPGVGISFGIDRIYDVMQELSLFPESLTEGTSVLFFNLGAQESLYSFNLMNECRNRGISCELFYESAKMDKQFKYAEKKKIPLVVIIGSREMSDKKCKIKNLNTGVEDTVEASELAAYLIKKL